MEYLLNQLKKSGVLTSDTVYDAMKQVDRADFTSSAYAYADSPQSISYNATISALHMHCHALQYLKSYLTPGAHVLDVGFGSGYLTVALSKMIKDSGVVVGIEHIDELYEFGKKNISKHHKNLLESGKIVLVNGDGRKGCEKYAPYKVIHVGAAADDVPQDLIKQLDNGGRMFIPVGTWDQWINVIDKDKNGKITERKVIGVRYVTFTDKKKQLGY